jgi:Uma2 family endonuclease
MASSSSGSERDDGVYAVYRRRRANARAKVMTLQEYFDTPETVLPQELIYGVMRVAESPTSTHQETVGALFIALHEHVRRQMLGTVWLAPLDVVLDEERALVIQPDLFVLLHGGRAVVTDKVEGPPDLVIEVLSPRPRIGDVVERLGWFREYGVRECWFVEPLTQRMQVLRMEAGELKSRVSFNAADRIISGLLPDFDQSLQSIRGY